MPLNVEPSTSSGPAPEPALAEAPKPARPAPRADVAAGRSDIPPSGTVGRRDSGSMRPLFVFLIVAALALTGSIVFALVHAADDREADQLADARADVVQAVDEGRAAQEGLAAQIETAESTLVASKGKVVDGDLRAELAGHIAAAKKLGDQQPPSIPEAGAAGLEASADLDALEAQATEWAMTMRTASTTLTSATEDVQESYRQWQQDRKDAQAEADAAADEAAQAADQLDKALKSLSTTTDQLKISVRDSQYTLDWAAGLNGPTGPRKTLLAHRKEGAAALAARADAKDLGAVQDLLDRRETARLAIEDGGWAVRATLADGSNGRIAQKDLCKMGLGPEGQEQYLRCDAAEDWTKLAAAFEAELGKPLRVEYGYRPYDWQLQALDEFGAGQVAEPGTSNHGWAAAVDVPVDDGFRFGEPEFEWLAANGPKFGWEHPDWARAGGGREEPWHFEYQG